MNTPQVNASGWAQAGRQAGDSFAKIAETTRKYSPRYDELAEVGLKARSTEKQAAIKAESKVRQTEINADAYVDKAKINIDRDESITKSKGTIRKAGMVAAAGAAIGMAIMPDEEPEIRPEQINYDKLEASIKGNQAKDQAAYDALGGKPHGGTVVPSASADTGGTAPKADIAPVKYDRSTSTLTKAQRAGLDVIGKYESDPVGGYDAVNQIGIAGGTAVLPGSFSGDIRKMSQHKGRSLTDMSVAEIMSLQNNSGANKQLSNADWVKQGRLHAVGRYQFIGPTFASEVQRQGIDPNAKFTPDLQDQMGLGYLQHTGIKSWVGPNNKATAAERALIQQARY